MENQNAFLMIEKGSPYFSHETITITKDKFLIGRASEGLKPDLSFTSPYISRNHAQIILRDGSYWLIDTSKCGIKVNGEKLAKSIPFMLKPGDRIYLAGNEAVLIFGIGLAQSETKQLFQPGIEIYLDQEKREIWIDGKKIDLTGNLYTLFALLYQNRGRVVSSKEIKKTVWPERHRGIDNDVPQVGDEEVLVLMNRLRGKLEHEEDLICNKRGFGYMLK